MSRPAISLRDLVYLTVGECDNGYNGAGFFASLVAPVMAAIDQGNFLQACRAAEEAAKNLPELGALAAACEFVERIDCFLATSLPGDGFALACSCRTDLELLSVLGDWLADNGRPQAAAEARHLLGLVRLETQGLGADSFGKTPLWWSQDIEPEDEMEME
jgi:hypothetical protein